MQRKIGEIFEFGGEWYQCAESDSCGECSLFTTECGSGTKSDLADKVVGQCCKVRRTDNKHVIFKKLEKVGEPITIYGEKFQLLNIKDRWCNGCALRSEGFCEFPEEIDGRKCDCGAGGIYVEIKQNQEDMEEKKLNLKPFDLEAARKGKPVCTRDGRKARIICFDAKDDRSIIALVESEIERKEIIVFYLDNGFYFNNEESQDDLMMLPEKKEGWVNISNCPDNGYSNYDSGVIVFKTKEEAINFTNNKDYIDTVKVTWEE